MLVLTPLQNRGARRRRSSYCADRAPMASSEPPAAASSSTEPLDADESAQLDALVRNHRVLRRRVKELVHGDAALARAWRAWSTLAKLRRQLDMLGLHLSRWRDEQLQRERWLRDALEEAPG